MKLITTIENDMGNNPNLICEFGFSIFIEDEDISLIFDTGQSGAFTKNISHMSIDTNKITHIIISHNHFDHGGGIKDYIKSFGNNFTLILNKNFFSGRYGFEKDFTRILSAGFSKKFLEDNNVKTNFIIDNKHKISKNITIFTNFKPITTFEKPNPTYFKREGDIYIPDNMNDELVLGLNTSKGYILLCGCSHFGIVNIIENIKPLIDKKIYGVIGGLHLNKSSNEKREKVIEYFKKEDIKYLALSHCTGYDTIQLFEKNGFSIIKNNTGNILEF